MGIPARRGFTLIEILIVISVIAVLASLLIPGISLAQRELNKVRCSNNLRQIGMGIETMRQEKDDLFPGRLVDLFDKNLNGPYEHGLEKLLICPADPSHGKNGFNRTPTNWGAHDELREDAILGRRVSIPPRTTPRLTPCSVMYEASDQQLDPGDLDDYDLLSYLYRAEPLPTTPVTWQVAKSVQQKHGNKKADRVTFGDPFPPGQFPVLRCFWHNHWTAANGKVDEKVINLSWELNTFKSIAFWEHSINNDIAIPP